MYVDYYVYKSSSVSKLQRCNGAWTIIRSCPKVYKGLTYAPILSLTFYSA